MIGPVFARARGLIAAALLCGVALPSTSRGEVDSRFGVGAWADPTVPSASSRFAPWWTLATSSSRLSLQGLASGRNQSLDPRGFMLSGTTWLEPPAGTGREISTQVSQRERGPGGELTSVRSELRLHVLRPERGAWVGLGTEVNNGAVTHDVWPALAIGGWARRQRFFAVLDLEQSVGRTTLRAPRSSRSSSEPDTSGFAPPDTAAGIEKDATLTTARAALQWARGRLALESSAGVTLSRGADPRRWARALATYQVLDRVAVFASVGKGAPALHTFEPSDERHATVGVSLLEARAPLTPAALAAAPRVTYRLSRLHGGRHELTVWAPGAARVELMGDMTGWEPVALSRMKYIRWTTMLELSPGVHQLSIRIDEGDWGPLPGAPTAPDGYGGTVSQIVAE